MKKIQKKKSQEAVKDPLHPYLHYALIFLVILLFAFIRFRLRDFPLERDEGEYSYAGQLMLQGIPPYSLACNMKLPGTYAVYAVILAAFGQTPSAVHWGLLLVNTATIIVIYLLGRRLFGSLAGVVACASYALLSTSPSVLGTAGHATHFVVLPALGGILLLLGAIATRRTSLFFWSGLLMGLGFLMKQPGIFFIVFACLFLMHSEWRLRPLDWRGSRSRGSFFCLGAILPFALTCLALLALGLFSKFWFWTFSYARSYASIMPVSQGLQTFQLQLPLVVGPAVWVWGIAGLGFFALLWDARARSKAFFTMGFLLFSFLAVSAGLYFRAHYFILVLPAVSLFAGLGVDSAKQKILQGRASRVCALAPILLFAAAFAQSLFEQRLFFFEMDPVTACRVIYRANPFVESLEVADYLRKHTTPDQKIAVLGSEPQIYFYAGRHSATGYLYTYSLMEPQQYARKMQEEMIGEIETARPAYIVLVDVMWSWGVFPDSDRHILSWAMQFLESQYELVGVVDIADATRTRWGDAASEYQMGSNPNLRVYRRKSPEVARPFAWEPLTQPTEIRSYNEKGKTSGAAREAAENK